ncbi:MAG: phage N-6-adenine-methyltransferase [Anaeroplasmataceae bacterium]|nr:phage N-6-adenine-methyltransferase [Anaeroplasmataceae bacterium]
MAGQMLYVKKGDKNMAKANVTFTKDNEYYTPKYVVDFFFPDGFDYDPATCEGKAKEFEVEHYDTIETNGLAQDWTSYKRIWINPPFTEKHKFLAKAVETYTIAHNEIYVLFPIEFLTTARFHDLNCKCKLFIPKGRINFESGLGKQGKSPAFGSVVIKLADENSVEYIDLKKPKITNIETVTEVVNSTTIETKKSWFI